LGLRLANEGSGADGAQIILSLFLMASTCFFCGAYAFDRPGVVRLGWPSLLAGCAGPNRLLSPWPGLTVLGTDPFPLLGSPPLFWLACLS